MTRQSNMTRQAALAATLLLAAGGLAQAQATTDPAKVTPGTYTVEPDHTRVLFSISHLGFTNYYGEFTHPSGTLTLDPANPAASTLSITIPAASISTSNTKLDGELKGAAWFDAAKYPALTFTSDKVQPTQPNTALVHGALTLHGVTKPVTLLAKFNAAGVNPLDGAYTVGFEVSGHIKRSDFGITKYLPLVGDDVNLIISAAFEAKH